MGFFWRIQPEEAFLLVTHPLLKLSYLLSHE